MNTYIFFTHSIVNVGGAEIYLRNKCNYLEKEGWRTYIFSYTQGEIIISDLKKYKTYIIPELFSPPMFFNKTQSNKVVEKIINNIEVNNSHNIIIESNNLYIALWGELIAKTLNAKHLLFNLQENDRIKSKGLYDFLSFKFHRKELVGIGSKSLQLLFKPFFAVSSEQSYYLSAFCNNPVEDINVSSLNNEEFDEDYKIGSLGRLEKPYLKTAIEDIIDFTRKHQEFKFAVYFIGGCNKKSKVDKIIEKKFRECPNVRLIISGYMYPIPLSLIREFDVFLCSAGSVRVTSNLGIPTISYCAIDLHPLGVFGYTTHNSAFRDKEHLVNGSDLLDDILLKKLYTKKKCEYQPIEYNFSSHIQFINESNSNNEYYQLNKYSYSITEKIGLGILRIGGFRAFKKAFFLFKNLRQF